MNHHIIYLSGFAMRYHHVIIYVAGFAAPLFVGI